MSAPSRVQTLAPRNFDEAMRFSEMLAGTDMVPKDYRGKPINVLVAIQWGMEVGLNPLQAVQNIAVINGRPSIWGDAALALVRGHPACVGVREGVDGEGDARHGWCEVTRRGEQPQRRTFSVADARKAGLWGKQGPWQQYPDRMLQLRARGFALRDVFPDALRGVITVEEAQDMPTVSVTAEEIKAASTNEGMRIAKEDMVAEGKAFRVVFPNGKDKLFGDKGQAWAAIRKAAERCSDRAELERLASDNEALLEWAPGYEKPVALADTVDLIVTLRTTLPDPSPPPVPASPPAGLVTPGDDAAASSSPAEPAANGQQPVTLLIGPAMSDDGIDGKARQRILDVWNDLSACLTSRDAAVYSATPTWQSALAWLDQRGYARTREVLVARANEIMRGNV